MTATGGRTLVIQIPCHNEEEILPRVLADRTAAIARAHGAQVLRLPVQRGAGSRIPRWP